MDDEGASPTESFEDRTSREAGRLLFVMVCIVAMLLPPHRGGDWLLTLMAGMIIADAWCGYASNGQWLPKRDRRAWPLALAGLLLIGCAASFSAFAVGHWSRRGSLGTSTLFGAIVLAWVIVDLKYRELNLLERQSRYWLIVGVVVADASRAFGVGTSAILWVSVSALALSGLLFLAEAGQLVLVRRRPQQPPVLG